MFLLNNLGIVLLVVVLVGVGKALIFGGLVRAFGYNGSTPLDVGLGLFQIGEFAFVLARVGLAVGAINAEAFALVLSTAVITMILTPFATSAVEPIWQRYERWRGGPPVQVYQAPDQSLQNHIIIVGYGRV